MQYKRTDTKRLKESKELKPWTIYLWQEGDCWRGASAVVTKDGIKAIYEVAWMMDDDTKTAKKNAWIAKQECKKQLTNTLNALNWYGKKITDRKGNIDMDKFRYQEVVTQAKAKKSGIIVPIEEVAPIKKFDTKEITAREAFDLQLS